MTLDKFAEKCGVTNSDVVVSAVALIGSVIAGMVIIGICLFFDK